MPRGARGSVWVSVVVLVVTTVLTAVTFAFDFAAKEAVLWFLGAN